MTESVTGNDQSIVSKPCVENGLVGWWKMDGNASDSSGNNNGTIYGATLAAGESGSSNSAYSFDGVDDYIEASNNIPMTENMTFSFWLNMNNFNNTGSAIGILEKRALSGNKGFIIFCYSNGQLTFDFGGTDVSRWNTLYVPPFNTWIYIVFTRTSSERTLYINSSSYASTNVSGITANDINTSTRFGNSKLASYPMSGLIDDVRIYSRALSASEISTLYSAGAQ